jgi:hypothetical protein
MKNLFMLVLLIVASSVISGCGGPAEGQAFEKADPKGGTAAGRLGTDEGAVQGISGGAPASDEKPAAEPIPPGG